MDKLRNFLWGTKGVKESVDKEAYKAKLKELPTSAIKAFRASDLTKRDIITNWEIFLICLHHCCRDLSFDETTLNGSLLLVDKLAKKERAKNKIKGTINSSSQTSENKDEFEGSEKDAVTPRKTFTLEEIEELLTKHNPKDFYENFHLIGKGGFGKVESATSLENEIVAIKTVNKPFDKFADRILAEVDVLNSCSHPNILAYKECYLYRNKISIVTELCDFGSLRQLLSIRLREEEIVYVLYHVLKGLSYLHSKGYMHRDIKSANIFINTCGEVKIGDFGLCVLGNRMGLAGSKYWCAPEMIIREPYDSQVDIWSLGAVLYEMIEGAPPYREFRSLKAIFMTATQGAPALKKHKNWSNYLKEFLNLCFIMDPAVRPTANELLKHPLFDHVEPKSEFSDSLRPAIVARYLSGN